MQFSRRPLIHRDRGVVVGNEPWKHEKEEGNPMEAPCLQSAHVDTNEPHAFRPLQPGESSRVYSLSG